MSGPTSDFLRIARERGYIHQTSDEAELDAALNKGGLVAYIGYDCTADSLHVGHLLPTMLLRLLQKTGGRPIALIGGGTTKVGDPSGKDEARQLLTDEIIEANKAGIRRTFDALLDFNAGAMMVNNADWLLKLNYVEFLRDVGRHFSVNRMLSFDSVKLRLDREQSLSFLEFNYMIMQGYDFTELNRRYGTVLQMGGSDQWGNIINGVDLNHRMGGEQLYALTTPLLTKASGEKMGKSASGAVWLNGDLFSPYDFWQYFRNTEDADVTKFLKIFTRLPLSEIEKLGALGGNEINEAKKVLATEATALLHGREAADAAAETARPRLRGRGRGGHAARHHRRAARALRGPGGGGRAGGVEGRGAAADRAERAAPERRGGERRGAERHGRRPARWCGEALGRAQAARAGARGLTAARVSPARR
jgi:tyrosyl-tRNA synthetase